MGQSLPSDALATVYDLSALSGCQQERGLALPSVRHSSPPTAARDKTDNEAWVTNHASPVVHRCVRRDL